MAGGKQPSFKSQLKPNPDKPFDVVSEILPGFNRHENKPLIATALPFHSYHGFG